MPRKSKLDSYADKIGILPDKKIAEIAGVSPENVRAFRKRRDIPARWRGQGEPLPNEDSILAEAGLDPAPKPKKSGKKRKAAKPKAKKSAKSKAKKSSKAKQKKATAKADPVVEPVVDASPDLAAEPMPEPAVVPSPS